MATFPTRSLGNSTLNLTPDRSWRLGDWRRMAVRMGDRRTTPPRSRRSGARSSAVSTGLTRHAIYGLGHSEEVVGQALRDIPRGEGRTCSRSAASCGTRQGIRRTASIRNRFAGKSNRACAACRRSASICTRFTGRSGRQARRDTIPASIEEAWATLTQLRDEGKVAVHRRLELRCRAVAAHLAHRNADQPSAAVFDAAPGDRTGDSAVLPRAQHRRDSVLADAVGAADRKDDARAHCRRCPKGDWRRNNRFYQEPLLSRAFSLVDRLRAIAEQHGRTPGEVAIAWTLRHPAITATIVGARNPQQIDELIGAATFRLSPQEIEELERRADSCTEVGSVLLERNTGFFSNFESSRRNGKRLQ